jgi:FtsZ-interacting cell division protein ZipA
MLKILIMLIVGSTAFLALGLLLGLLLAAYIIKKRVITPRALEDTKGIVRTYGSVPTDSQNFENNLYYNGSNAAAHQPQHTPKQQRAVDLAAQRQVVSQSPLAQPKKKHKKETPPQPSAPAASTPSTPSTVAVPLPKPRSSSSSSKRSQKKHKPKQHAAQQHAAQQHAAQQHSLYRAQTIELQELDLSPGPGDITQISGTNYSLLNPSTSSSPSSSPYKVD